MPFNSNEKPADFESTETDQLKKAITLAKEAHKGQVDKGGQDYIKHPLRLMEQMPTEELKIIAVLHDVVEDSHYTFEDLLKEGFSADTIDALRALTKQENEPYEDFIQRVKKNTLAIKVKLADLHDNSNLDRIPNPTEKDLKRIEKYKKAIKELSD